MSTTVSYTVAAEKEKEHKAALRALERVRKRENQLKKKGWRWIRVNNRLQVFVPCTKSGKPTKFGENLIKQRLESV